MRVLPGQARSSGPVTADGNVPVYKANGVAAFVVTIALFVGRVVSGSRLFSPSIVYDNFGGILGALNVFSLVFCLVLYLKGRFAPSSERPRHQRQSHLRLLLGHRALPARPRLGREDVHQLPLRNDGLAAHSPVVRGEAAASSTGSATR